MTMNKEETAIILERIYKELKDIQKKLDRIDNHRACLNGDFLLDTQDVASMLRVTPRSIQRWVKSGKLKSLKIEGICMFSNNELLRFIREDYEG